MSGDRADDWKSLVDRLDDETVRRLLVGAAETHEAVGRAVTLEASTDAERVSLLRSLIDDGLRTRRFLGYRESTSWAIEAFPIVDALADAVEAAPSRELVELLERAAGHVVKVILRADDSNGMIGDLARRILDLHARACDSGVADPARLAKWMIRFGFDDQDFFAVDPVRYAAALGDKGLDRFRQEVGERASLEDRPFAVKYALERLAVLDGDTDSIVSLLGGDLSRPHQFIQVAEAMVELERTDEALAWAQRGIEATSGWQIAKLFDIAVDVLGGRDDLARVLELRREQVRRMPSATSYSKLKLAAVAAGCWESEREAALALLGESDLGALVDALLADGDHNRAWDVTTTNPDWDAGEVRLTTLAEQRELIDPHAAMDVYLRLAELALRTANRQQYRVAASRLKDAKRAAAPANRTVEFEQVVAGLREQHRRRPTLITILDKAGASLKAQSGEFLPQPSHKSRATGVTGGYCRSTTRNRDLSICPGQLTFA